MTEGYQALPYLTRPVVRRDTAHPAVPPLSWVLASVAALVGFAPFLLWGGLVVPPQLIMLVAALTGGLCAGLVASWIHNAFAPSSSTRLLVVVGATTASALVVAAGMYLGAMFASAALIVHLLGALLLGGFGAWAARHFRSPHRHLRRDALISLALLITGAALILLALFGFCTTLLTCSAYSGPV